MGVLDSVGAATWESTSVPPFEGNGARSWSQSPDLGGQARLFGYSLFSLLLLLSSCLFYFSQRNFEPGSLRNDDRELRRPLASPVCEEFFPLGRGAHRFLAIAQWFVHLPTHP